MAINSDKDRVRLLISDVGGNDGLSFVFSDNEIIEFLNMRSGSIYKAAATALRTMASNAVLVSKRIRFLELETNGPEEAKALRELAKELEDTAATDSDVIDIIEPDTTIFADRVLRRGSLP